MFPSIVLPQKIYKILAPAIIGGVGVSREVKWCKFIKVFTGYWGCSIQHGKGNVVKVIPPSQGESWPFERRTFVLYKPSDGRLHRQDLERYRSMFKERLNWDRDTFVCESKRSR